MTLPERLKILTEKRATGGNFKLTEQDKEDLKLGIRKLNEMFRKNFINFLVDNPHPLGYPFNDLCEDLEEQGV